MSQREISGHEVDGEPVVIRVLAMDSPGDGGASYQYRFERHDGSQVGFLNFHYGAVDLDNDANGVTIESVMACLADRLRGFQSGPFKCKENVGALKKIEEAMEFLKARTEKRLEKNIVGQLVA